MANKILLDNPEYCMKLHKTFLRELTTENVLFRTYFPKWKKGILVVILEKDMPLTKRKPLRRKVIVDLGRIVDEAFELLGEDCGRNESKGLTTRRVGE